MLENQKECGLISALSFWFLVSINVLNQIQAATRTSGARAASNWVMFKIKIKRKTRRDDQLGDNN